MLFTFSFSKSNTSVLCYKLKFPDDISQGTPTLNIFSCSTVTAPCSWCPTQFHTTLSISVKFLLSLKSTLAIVPSFLSLSVSSFFTLDGPYFRSRYSRHFEKPVPISLSTCRYVCQFRQCWQLKRTWHIIDITACRIVSTMGKKHDSIGKKKEEVLPSSTFTQLRN